MVIFNLECRCFLNKSRQTQVDKWEPPGAKKQNTKCFRPNQNNYEPPPPPPQRRCWKCITCDYSPKAQHAKSNLIFPKRTFRSLHFKESDPWFREIQVIKVFWMCYKGERLHLEGKTTDKRCVEDGFPVVLNWIFDFFFTFGITQPIWLLLVS